MCKDPEAEPTGCLQNRKVTVRARLRARHVDQGVRFTGWPQKALRGPREELDLILSFMGSKRRGHELLYFLSRSLADGIVINICYEVTRDEISKSQKGKYCRLRGGLVSVATAPKQP